ncbi:MAG: DUF6625 family protein [Ruminococcus sp.]|jgi:hypothetical protein
MNSVAVICAYFGKLPSCYGVWQRSCEYNPSIDFLLFTDQKVPEHPQNIHVIAMDFEDIKALVDRKMGCHVALEYPYKLCDLKPMYGVIFEDYIKYYDYWGHCDMDMVFGDIRSFFDRYELEKYDKFLDLGHLSLYRNTVENNYRFKCDGSQCGSWENVVNESKGHAFDERNGIYQIYKSNGFSVFDKRIYADIAIIYKRFRCALEDVNYDQQIFYWERGKTFRDYWVNGERKSEEFIYIHFKKRDFKTPDFLPEKSTMFYIGPNGFTEKQGETNVDIVAQVNPFKGSLHEKLELIYFKFSFYKNRIFDRIKDGGASNGK